MVAGDGVTVPPVNEQGGYGLGIRRHAELFEEALERPPEERQAFVEAGCGGNSELKEQVMALLLGDAQDEALVDQPALSALHRGRGPDLERFEGRRIGP